MATLEELQKVRGNAKSPSPLMQDGIPHFRQDDIEKGVDFNNGEAPLASYSKHTEQMVTLKNEENDNRQSMLSNTINQNSVASQGEKQVVYIAGKQLSVSNEQLSVARKQAATLTQIHGIMRDINLFNKQQAKKINPKYQAFSKASSDGASQGEAYTGKPEGENALEGLGSAIGAVLGTLGAAGAGKTVWDRIKSKGKSVILGDKGQTSAKPQPTTQTPKPTTQTSQGTQTPKGNPGAPKGTIASRIKDAWKNAKDVKLKGRAGLLVKGAAVIGTGLGINSLMSDNDGFVSDVSQDRVTEYNKRNIKNYNDPVNIEQTQNLFLKDRELMRSFLNSKEGARFSAPFQGKNISSAEFLSEFVNSQTNQEFTTAQQQYVDRTRYTPTSRKIENYTKVDFDRSQELRNVLQDVSYSYDNAGSMVVNALSGRDTTNLSDSEITTLINNYINSHGASYKERSEDSMYVNKYIQQVKGNPVDTLQPVETKSLMSPGNVAAITTMGAATVLGPKILNRADAPEANKAAWTSNEAKPAQPKAPKPPKAPKVKAGGLGKSIPYLNVALGAYDAYSVITDDTLTKHERNRELTGVATGTAAAAGGAAAGAAIGSAFFGVGAIPGAIIGGALGMLGYYVGSDSGKAAYDLIAGPDPEISPMGADVSQKKPVLVHDVPQTQVKNPPLASDNKPVDKRMPVVDKVTATKLTEQIKVLEKERDKELKATTVVSPIVTTQKPVSVNPAGEITPNAAEIDERIKVMEETKKELLTIIPLHTTVKPTSSSSVSINTPSVSTGIVNSSVNTSPSNTNVTNINSNSNKGADTRNSLFVDSRTTYTRDNPVVTPIRKDITNVRNGINEVTNVTDVDSPTNKFYYSGDDISTTTMSANTSSLSTVSGSVTKSSTYAEPAKRNTYEPIKTVMMLEPKRQETMMPGRFKPEGDRIPTKGISDSTSSRQTIDGAPAVISDSGLILLQTGYI